MTNLLDYTLDELKLWMKKNDEKEFRAKQIIDWIYKNIYDFDNMRNIPAPLKEKLKKSFCIYLPIVEKYLQSQMDETKKFLFKLEDGNFIESVVMKYKYGYSICVSTQVGCRMGCKFCASTIGGMVRNLTGGEILGQIISAQNTINEKISNVVLMGSGEPLDNFDNVIKFLELVNAEYGLNIGQRHITLSTCGIIPKIKELADRNLQITLAISLHASSDEIRKKTMPISYKYSIVDIIDICKYYINRTGRRITFEYALVKDVNDSIDEAKRLASILKDMLCHVNLIPVNEVSENDFEKSTDHQIKAFQKVLLNEGIETTIRREMGADINAACGQLRRSYIN